MITITIKAVAGGFVASVNTTKGPIEGKPCTSPKFAVKSLRAVTKAAGRELPPANELNLIGDITPAVIPTNSAIEFINDDSTPAVQPMEAAPDTEREPELHPALVTPAGLITPVEAPERWLGAYNLAKMAIGPEGQPVDLIKVMKAAGFASPWSLDGQGRAFHTYTEARKEIVPAPKAGEGARRILQNNNGYNRDFKGRTPMEPGSLARETDSRHPGNRPERNVSNAPRGKAARMEAAKAANANLRANDPAGFEAKNLASKLAAQVSKANGGDVTAYKTAFVAVCTVLGAGRLDKCQKFAADLGMTTVPTEWLEWAAKETAKAA